MLAMLLAWSMVRADVYVVTKATWGHFAVALGTARNHPGPDTVRFDPSLKGKVIMVEDYLRMYRAVAPNEDGVYVNVLAPEDEGFTTIDGDVDGDGKPDITLDGTLLRGTLSSKDHKGYAAKITTPGNVLNGLAFVNYPCQEHLVSLVHQDGVTADGNIVQNCHFGIDAALASYGPNGDPAANRWGYEVVAWSGVHGTVIRGNRFQRSVKASGGEIGIRSTRPATGGLRTLVEGNLIGVIDDLDPAVVPSGVVAVGIDVKYATNVDVVGNTVANAANTGVNVWSGDASPANIGAHISICDNTVLGTGSQGIGVYNARDVLVSTNDLEVSCYMAIAASGTEDLSIRSNALAVASSSGKGIQLSASARTVVSGNWISGALYGIQASSLDVVQFSGNDIVESTNDGVSIRSATGMEFSGNSVSGSKYSGLVISGLSDDCSIKDNSLSGNQNGIYAATTVWGFPAYCFGTIEGNAIFGNASRGVVVRQDSAGDDLQLVITRNSMFGNGDLGIDLAPSWGITYNDAGDTDVGANGLLNMPVFTRSTISGGGFVIEGTAPPNSKVEIFQAAPTRSGYGEGKTFLSEATAAADGTFTATVPAGVFPITATATLDGCTSEFSRNNVAPAAVLDDQFVEQTSSAGAEVFLDGSKSADPDGDPLVYSWDIDGDGVFGDGEGPLVTLPFGPGQHTVSLRVTDLQGLSGTATAVIVVRDTTPPEIAAPADLVLEQEAPEGNRDVALGVPTILDAVDAAPSVTNDAPEIFAAGTTLVTWMATDDSGNASTAEQQVTVEDTTPPKIVSLSVTPDELWPPNHKMRSVEVRATLVDAADPNPTYRIVDIASNQPEDDGGGVVHESDMAVTGAHTAELRAERTAHLGERTYTIEVEATDAAGNASGGIVTVRVPLHAAPSE
jgi:hypothetical protein